MKFLQSKALAFSKKKRLQALSNIEELREIPKISIGQTTSSSLCLPPHSSAVLYGRSQVVDPGSLCRRPLSIRRQLGVARSAGEVLMQRCILIVSQLNVWNAHNSQSQHKKKRWSKWKFVSDHEVQLLRIKELAEISYALLNFLLHFYRYWYKVKKTITKKDYPRPSVR